MALVDEIKSQESGNGQSIVLQRPSLLIQHISEHGAEGLNQEYVDTALTNGLGFGATAAGVKKDSDGKINLLYNYTRRRNEDKSSSETSATPAPGSVQAENLEFLSQYQQENSLLARLKKAGQAAISGIKDAVASNTDAQRALYEAGQSGREMRMQEDVKEIEENLARARRDYDQLLQLHNGDTNDKDVKAAVNVIDHYEALLSAYKKAPEAQRGATEETSKLADEVKKSAEKDIERIKKNSGRFERFGIDVVSGLAQFAVDRAIGGLLGTTTATPALVARAFGGATQQARQGGGTIGQQIAYGSAVATVEAITEKLADGLAGAYGPGAADDIAEEVIRRLAKSPAGQTALRTLYGMGSEFAEEFVSSAANPTLRSIYNGKTVGQNYSEESVVDWLYDGMIAAATSLVSGTPERILSGQDARLNALNESVSSIYEQMNEKPGVKQAVKDRGILDNIKGGKDYGNLSIGEQASEAMEALRGRTPESVRAGQLAGARNRLFEIQQQRAAEAQAAQAAKPVAESATTDAPTRPSNPLYASIQAAHKAAAALEVQGGKIAQPSQQSTAQAVKSGDYEASSATPEPSTEDLLEKRDALWDRYEELTDTINSPATKKEEYAAFVQERANVMEELRKVREALNPRTEPVAESSTTPQTPENAPQTQEAPTGEITPPTAQTAQSAAGAQPQAAETAQARLERAQARYAELESAFDNGEVSEADADDLSREMEQRYSEIQELKPLAERERQSTADAQTQQARVQNGEVSKGYGTPENHIDRRTPENVGNVGMKSFQFDNPQLHGYYVEAAQALMDEVQAAEAVDYERKVNKNTQRKTGSAIKGPVRRLMDLGLTKPQILKCLEDIISDNGQENYAAAKKVELVLNDMLTNGWTSTRGRKNYHEPNAAYVSAKDAIGGGIKADSWEKYLAQNELSIIDGTVTEEELRAEWERMHPQEAAAATEPEAAPEASQPVETESAGEEQSARTIPASEQTTAERTNGAGNERERNMSRNLRGNEKAEPELRNSFEQNRDLYTQLTNAEVAAKAAEIVGKGYDAAKNDIYEKIGQAKAGAKLAPEYAVAGYQLANEMVRRGETEAARELCADIAAELTYAGQVGQIGRLILAADPSIRIRTVERLVKKLNDGLSNRQKAKNVKKGVGTESGEIKVSDEALQRYAEAETDEAANDAMDAIEQEIADQIPATFRDKFTALRYLNMLGNLKTQARNIVGNTVMMAATNAKYLTQHVGELAAAAATGGEYQVNTALITSKELRQQAAADFEANIDEIKGDAKFSDVGRQAAKGVREKQQIFGAKTGNALWDNTGRRIGQGLEVARKATNAAMDIGDEIFLRQVYVRSFAGWMKAHGITDVNNASAEQVSAAREFAKKEAQEATFHDSNQFSDWVSSFDANWDKGHSEKVNKIGAAGKMIAQGIMPFRKTPANVAVRAIEYSPVGIAGTIYTAVQAKKGNASAADVINSAAKNLTGTALFVAGMMLSAAGRARASGDDEDEKLTNFQKLQGAMDYSVKVGDTYISLSQLAPIAIPFFMGVKLNELLEYSDNLFSADSIGDILGVVSEPMLEMSMLSGVNDFLNDLSSVSGDTDALPSLIGNAALSYLSQGLTNSLLGQLEQASERTRQTTYSDTKSKDATWFDRFLGKSQYKIGEYSAKIPGIDYNQQDYVDAWGRTQSNGGVGERAFNAFLNPTYTGKDRSTDVDEELERLYSENRDKADFPNVFPQKRSRSDAIGDGVVMTPDEYLSYSKESGQKKLELVREFIQSADYKNLTDEQRAETIHNLYAFADATALQKVRDANGVTVENEYAKISDLSDVPAYLAATERFKAEAAKEGKEFNGWTNTNFEKYVSAGLKAEDLDVLAESALSDTRKPAYDLMRVVGMSPKEYMDAIAEMDGEKHDGQFKQADVYSWLAKNNAMSTEQKNQLWDMLGNNWKTSYADYAAKNGGDESKATKSSGNALYDYYAERMKNAK